jgi:methylated-DNA-[protein]-cysteine S-methyltransferase
MESPFAYYDFLDTALGPLCLCVDSARNLIAIDFTSHVVPFQSYAMRKAASECDRVKQELSEYFNGKRKVFSLSYSFPAATDFQITVWNALLKVPYGETISYGNIARMIKKPAASRAAGNAAGANRIPICIPCHRLIRSDGSIGGYSAGLDIKRALLALEQKYLAI